MVDVNNIFRYPDVVSEVFSENSAHTDQGEKLLEYIQLPSLQHDLLVSQSEYLVEIYSHRDTECGFLYYKNPNDTIELAALGVQMKIQDLYEKVHFEMQQEA